MAENNYYVNKIELNITDNKNTWETISEIIGKKNKPKQAIEILQSNNNTNIFLKDKYKIANTINRQTMPLYICKQTQKTFK